MKHFILNFIIVAGLLFIKYPKDITGKWQVDEVDAINAERGKTPEQIATIDKLMVEPFTNSIFEFKPDHHFYLSAQILNMPKDDFWEYDADEGIINIREYKDKTSLVMQLKILERGSDIYFLVHETRVLLKMKRL